MSAWKDEVTIRILPGGVIEIEGVKFSTVLISQVLRNPHRGMFTFKREGDQMVITQIRTIEEAEKYLNSGERVVLT